MRKRQRGASEAEEERPAKSSRRQKPTAELQHDVGAETFSLTFTGLRSQLRLRQVDGAQWKGGAWCEKNVASTAFTAAGL